jgi:hypothetical protein
MKSFLLLSAFLVAAGCTSRSTVLVNSKGEQRQCDTTGYGVVGSLMAQSKHGDCVSAGEKDGFKPKNM